MLLKLYRVLDKNDHILHNKKLDIEEFPHVGLMNIPKKMFGMGIFTLSYSFYWCLSPKATFPNAQCPHAVLTLHCSSSPKSVPPHKMFKVLQLLTFLFQFFNTPDLD